MPGACLTISDVDQPVDHTPLIVACLRGDLAMVRYLVCEAYVDVNQCSTTRVCRNSCPCYQRQLMILPNHCCVCWWLHGSEWLLAADGRLPNRSYRSSDTVAVERCGHSSSRRGNGATAHPSGCHLTSRCPHRMLVRPFFMPLCLVACIVCKLCCSVALM